MFDKALKTHRQCRGPLLYMHQQFQSQCGGQDNEISVFKAGRECEAGLEMLKAAAAEEEQEFEEDPYEEEHLLADSEDKDDKIVEQDDGDISDD